MSTPPVRTRRWSRAEYERMIDKGIFQPDERLELIDGELIVGEPQTPPHAVGVSLAKDALWATFTAGCHVRARAPVALDDASEPEPDVSVVRGAPRDYRDAHPREPVLLVEVADASLTFDRRWKGSLYARADVADYWILNVADRVLEVYRQPVRSASARYGWKYRNVRLLKSGAVVSPLAAPKARIRVADLLP